MKRNRQNRRIEPSFGKSGARLTVRPEDRLVAPPARGQRRKRKTRRRRSGGGGVLRVVRRLAYWSVVLCLWAAIAGAGYVAYVGARMPAATTWEVPGRPPNVKIVATDGTLIANRGMTGGEAIRLSEMSPHIPKAVVAIEDRRFYSHFGFDPVGLARAAFINLTSGRWVQGGSTLTQQLAKNLFLQPDRTLERKIQEVLLAFWLEHQHSKDEILEMYLNRVYFGSGAYGVEAAARRYFGKPARQLNLAESALLAGLLKAPSRLSPARDPEAAAARAQLVLAAMRDQGMIGDGEMAAAMSAPAVRAAAYWTGSEHYVADRVMELLPGLIGEVREDVIVETTVDMTLQKLAEKAIRRTISAESGTRKVSQGALVSIDGSGAVRAMVGGYDYATSQFDRASEARRQPGSAFKPFVFLAALERGQTPASLRVDAPVRVGKWAPENFRGKYQGEVSLTEALAQSLNSVAVQLAMEVGPRAVAETAYRLGIETRLGTQPSLALGAAEVSLLELTAAYVPFANGGLRPPVRFVERVTTTTGKVLYAARTASAPRVIRPEHAAMMNSMLAAVVDHGTGRGARFGWPAAGKTGTSQNARDAWFVGYTANLVTGVWFGNDDGRAMRDVTGGTLPVTAWKEFMQAAHAGLKPVALRGGLWRPDPEIATIPAAPQPPSGVSTESSGSIRRPVPPADVGGGRSARTGTSLLDRLFGR